MLVKSHNDIKCVIWCSLKPFKLHKSFSWKTENRSSTGVMTATGVRDLRHAISVLKKLPDKSKFFRSNEHSPALHRQEEMSELTAGCWLMIIRQRERKKLHGLPGWKQDRVIGPAGCQVTAGHRDWLSRLPGHRRAPLFVAWVARSQLGSTITCWGCQMNTLTQRPPWKCMPRQLGHVECK